MYYIAALFAVLGAMELSNSIRKEEKLSLSFDADNTKIYQTFEVDEHYNLIAKSSHDLAAVLFNSIETLSTHKDLTLTPPGNYHVTISILPLTASEKIIHNIQQICQKHSPLYLTVRGLHIRSMGIFANAYSQDGELGVLRAQIAASIGMDFDPSDRLANVGWFTLGRFIERASENTLHYIQQRTTEEFGTLVCKPSLYKSKSRQQLGELIW